MDMIFTARQLQEKCREQQRELYAVFVDLTKAYSVDRTVRAVSSVPVAVTKMALSVHVWLTKHKEGPQYTSFSCPFLAFSLCTHGKCNSARTTGRLDTPITALYCISVEKLVKCFINVVVYS